MSSIYGQYAPDFGVMHNMQGLSNSFQQGSAGFPYAQSQQHKAILEQQAQMAKAKHAEILKTKVSSTKETTVSEKELLPDISLTRVLKWAVVLLVAMALGSKVWEKFGAKVTAQLHKAIEAV